MTVNHLELTNGGPITTRLMSVPQDELRQAIIHLSTHQVTQQTQATDPMLF